MNENERQIGEHRYSRASFTCPDTKLPYWSYYEYTFNKSRAPSNLVYDHESDGWTLNRRWDKSPVAIFKERLGKFHMVPALPRSPTPQEQELAKMRDAGNVFAANMLQQQLVDAYDAAVKADPNLPPPINPPEIIGDSSTLFTIDASRVVIGANAVKILGLNGDEIRAMLKRHVAGDGGTTGSFRLAASDWTADSSFIPVLEQRFENAATVSTKFGLVKSVWHVWRPVDSGNHGELGTTEFGIKDNPRSNNGVVDRRRNQDDNVTVLTLLVPGSQSRTLMFSSRDNETTIMPG